MRIIGLARLLAAGLAITAVNATPGLAATHPDTPLAIEQRAFFPRLVARHPTDARALLVPLAAAPKPKASPKRRRINDQDRDQWPTLDGQRGRQAASDPAEPAPRETRTSLMFDPLPPLPVVPRPLTAPPIGFEAPGREPPPAIPLLRVEELWLARLPARPRVCSLCEPTKVSSAFDPAPMSRQRRREPMSTRGSDPLAIPDAEQEEREAVAAPAPEFIMPFAHGRVTSLFNQGRRHPAIDLAGALGSPVLATTVGQRVVFAGWRGGYGNAVITSDGYGRTHLYGHLRSITSRVGQLLQQGEKLGHLGSTGHSTGPHVHYEVKGRNGQHINPVTLLFPARRVAVGYAWRDVRPQTPALQVAAKVAR